MNDKEINVKTSLSIPFGTLCWIVWIVFMILYYGTGTIAHWPIFWIWFPFWLPFALCGACLLVALICSLILALLDR